MIDRATVDKIMDAANIVDVVSEFVTLRKSGANYKGLCPFHNERTPSFYVSPARGICKCFSCGKGGTPVGFIMEHEQMTYPEALRWLAKKYNIEIKERELNREEREAESKRESMFIVNEWAAQYFEDTLHKHPDGITYGLQYFRSRGIRDDIIRKFRLGYDLRDRSALPREALRRGYQREFLLSTGLCYAKDRGDEAQEQAREGELVDRFAGRVMFPWLSMSGKVVAFGGRKLDQATKGVQQKYVNSPDSDIYHKEQNLYGIYQAKKAIARENLVYMVEGYTDVISMHQCGIENVVANSGTALSIHQIRMLHRFTPNIVLLYDGDEAGIHAAMRGTDMLLQEGMNIKVMLLPDGDDPDSFARKHPAAEFKQYIEQHQADFIQFKSDLLLKGVTDPIKRSEAISSIVRSISVIPDQIVRATYLTDCAHRLGINENTLISSMNKMIREEKARERGRDISRSGERGAGSDISRSGERGAGSEHSAEAIPGQDTSHSSLLAPRSSKYPSSPIDLQLITQVIRHGEEILFRNVETDDGQLISLNVAQYISYDLGVDGLAFANPLYNRVLDEAVQHAADPGFKAADYFTRHPDIEISTLAAETVIDRVQLSKSLQMKQEEDTLRNKVEHMLLEFRRNYVEGHLKEAQRQLSMEPGNMEVMQEYQRLLQMRNAIAKKLGRSIVA